ncbi:MAG: hypothetical protein Q7K44_03220 [Candidatus Liptonbacteria bacterium]|nr:hypothetical protein [Candidatus Liptonbacteria bacterium]
MKQTTKRFLSLIISFILFTGTLIVYFNLVVPANDEQQTIKAQAIGRQNFVDNQKAAISQVSNMINSYKGEGELQDVISSILPQSPDLAGAFSQISGLVQVNKLLMERVAVNAPVNQNISGTASQGDTSQQFVKPVGSVDFQVKVIGTYEDFKSFLKNVETNIRIFDVKKIDMQPTANAKPNQNIYNYDIIITAYYQNNL